MLVLDTDIPSLFQAAAPAGERVRRRMQDDGRPAAVTVVSFIEQFRGRLAECHRATAPDEFIEAAYHFRRTYDFFRPWRVLDFDDRAAAEFRSLKAAKIRVGTMDLHIAAVVLANRATLITRNLSDFRKVPGLDAEDWTAA